MISKSRLVLHPKYPIILEEYNIRLKRDGKVNNLQFFNEVIAPEIPQYKLMSWYQFLRRFKTVHGLVPATPVTDQKNIDPTAILEHETAQTMFTNDQATQRGIKIALNLGAVF